MLEILASSADELDVVADGDSIASLSAIKDRSEAKIAGAVAEFDRNLLWAFDPAASMHAWLRAKGRCSDCDAVRLVDTARKLSELPAVCTAWLEGRLSSGHVDVICSNADCRTLPVFAPHDTALCAAVEGTGIRGEGGDAPIGGGH